MSFEVAADAYFRFMGRFSEPLAHGFADLVDPAPGDRVLDVGCGPGALTAVLVARVGDGTVAAIDPSAPFVEAARTRFPGLDVRRGTAEALPYDDDTFDAALAQLVVHFMADPVGGLREMARVVRPGGAVAACVWDHAGGGSPLGAYQRAVRELDPGAADEADLAGSREGQLVALMSESGLRDARPHTVGVDVRFDSFEDWWEPYSYGIGPAGQYVASLDDDARERLRARCEELLGAAPFTIRAFAWAAVGTVA